jgi:hypothetical protein
MASFFTAVTLHFEELGRGLERLPGAAAEALCIDDVGSELQRTLRIEVNLDFEELGRGLERLPGAAAETPSMCIEAIGKGLEWLPGAISESLCIEAARQGLERLHSAVWNSERLDPYVDARLNNHPDGRRPSLVEAQSWFAEFEGRPAVVDKDLASDPVPGSLDMIPMGRRLAHSVHAQAITDQGQARETWGLWSSPLRPLPVVGSYGRVQSRLSMSEGSTPVSPPLSDGPGHGRRDGRARAEQTERN